MNISNFTGLLTVTLGVCVALICAIVIVLARRTYMTTRQTLLEAAQAFMETAAESDSGAEKPDAPQLTEFTINGEPIEVKRRKAERTEVPKGPRPPILNITERFMKWLDYRRAVGEGKFDAPDRDLRAAERNIALAVIFLPARQRDRYREEWAAEMHALDRQDVAAFALRVLIRAPRAGLALLLSKVFGRTPA